jgi:hypothetical protein
MDRIRTEVFHAQRRGRPSTVCREEPHHPASQHDLPKLPVRRALETLQFPKHTLVLTTGGFSRNASRTTQSKYGSAFNSSMAGVSVSTPSSSARRRVCAGIFCVSAKSAQVVPVLLWSQLTSEKNRSEKTHLVLIIWSD